MSPVHLMMNENDFEEFLLDLQDDEITDWRDELDNWKALHSDEE
jgi:hypothetical protein